MPRNSGLPELGPRDAFVHVANDYRYFSLACFAWEHFGPPGTDASARDAINALVPGIGVPVQDSLLLRARALIEFYVRQRSDPTDIVLSDFGLPSPPQSATLKQYLHAISVHAGHLAAWRDPDYRLAHQAAHGGAERQRPPWETDIPKIIDALYGALGHASTAGARWSPPFAKLHAACVSTRTDVRSFDWPADLGGKSDVLSYLASVQGLPP